MRKLLFSCLLLLMLTAMPACNQEPQYTAYSENMMDYFDTVITIVGYTETEAEFKEYVELARQRFEELHQLYDIYSNYPRVNNVKTINDKAGIEPVQVQAELLDLIIFAQDWTITHDGKTNIALGPVLSLWHDYRNQGIDNPNAQLPPIDKLEAAAQHADIRRVTVDTDSSTVFLEDAEMSLDLGALAKGYATELVAQELIEAGLESGAISSGGNVRTMGKPLTGKHDNWAVNIMDPDSYYFSEDKNLDTVYVHDASVVSSGDYQRYYYVDEVRYHHLIDPNTLMPADYYRALTVVTPDSGFADLLSTELFLLPYQESRELADSLENVEVLWIMPDGEVRTTQGMETILRSHGAGQ